MRNDRQILLIGVIVAGAVLLILSLVAAYVLLFRPTPQPAGARLAGDGVNRLAAPVAAPLASGPAIPAGTYKGSYRCRQGWTDLVLEIEAPVEGGQRGLARFGGRGLPEGAYTVDVQPESGGRFLLKPRQWQRQPPGYVMVAARVEVVGQMVRGEIVDEPACGSLQVERTG